jgi:hypothetical protein
VAPENTMGMQSEVVRGLWLVETTTGTSVVPFDVVPHPLVRAGPDAASFVEYVEGEVQFFEARPLAYAARLTMPGYLDATEWEGPFDTAAAALAALWADGCPACGAEDVERDSRGWTCGECDFGEAINPRA